VPAVLAKRGQKTVGSRRIHPPRQGEIDAAAQARYVQFKWFRFIVVSLHAIPHYEVERKLQRSLGHP